MTDENNEPQPIDDPESYINERRLKTIFDLREEIHELRRKTKYASHDEKYDSLCAYRSAVGSYIMEVEPLLHKYEAGKELVYEHEFGSVLLQVPIRETDNYTSSGVEAYIPRAKHGPWVSVIGVPEPVIVDMEGLISVVKSPDPLEYSFVLEKQSQVSSKKYQRRVTEQIPFEILDDMVRKTNNFLGEVGFEADLEQKEDPLKL